MAINAGQVFELAIRGVFYGQRVQNVFHYRNVGGAADLAASGMCEAWWNDIKAAWRGFMKTEANLIYTEVVSIAVNGSGHYGSYLIPTGEQQGTSVRAGEFLPTFNAANITFNPALRLVRPGSKRIAGVLESDQVNGVLTAGAQALLGAIATQVVNGFVDAATPSSWEFVIYGPANASRPVPVSQLVTGHSVSPNVTSQLSRKLGRGI